MITLIDHGQPPFLACLCQGGKSGGGGRSVGGGGGGKGSKGGKKKNGKNSIDRDKARCDTSGAPHSFCLIHPFCLSCFPTG